MCERARRVDDVTFAWAIVVAVVAVVAVVVPETAVEVCRTAAGEDERSASMPKRSIDEPAIVPISSFVSLFVVVARFKFGRG